MKDYSAMSDSEINNYVYLAKEIGRTMDESEVKAMQLYFNPCNNPADAWPIIAANHIAVVPYLHALPQAWPTALGVISTFTTEDKNPLRAAMIVYLQMMEAKP